MARVKVKLPPHDCQPPDMVERIETVETVVGRWPFKKVKTTHEKIYRASEAAWECPKCGTEWRFGYILPRVWSISRRVEEKWEWIDV